jgi:guanylate kinase
VDYHFVPLRRFQEMELAGEFLETDVAYGEHYGLPMSALNGDGDLAVVITVDGARSARFLLGSTFSIFIMPPAPEAAAARIAARSAPNEALRVAAYAAEAEAVAEYDAVVVNDDFERTVAHVATLIELRRKTSGCAISATCRAQLSPAA